MNDLVVQEGEQIEVVGELDLEGPRLWVPPSWRPDSGTRLEGGDIGITLAGPGLPRQAAKMLVVLRGRWTRSGVLDATVSPIDGSNHAVSMPGKLNSPSPKSLSMAGREAVNSEVWNHAEPVGLAIGADSRAILLQLLFVTTEFAEWYHGFDATRVDIHVSVVPIRALSIGT